MEIGAIGTGLAFLGIAVMGAGALWAITSAYRAGRATTATVQAIRFTGAGVGTLIAAFALLVLAIPHSALEWPITGLLALPLGLLGVGVILWSAKATARDESTQTRP